MKTPPTGHPMNTPHTPTPGPWHVATYADVDPSFTIVRGDLTIASIVGPRRNGNDRKRVPTQDESEANAQLIASAPSLLSQRNELREALKALTGFTETLMAELNESTSPDDKHRRANTVSRHVCRNETFRHVGSFLEQARAALANAKD